MFTSFAGAFTSFVKNFIASESGEKAVEVVLPLGVVFAASLATTYALGLKVCDHWSAILGGF